MTDSIKSWIQERRAIHTAATEGPWAPASYRPHRNHINAHDVPEFPPGEGPVTFCEECEGEVLRRDDRDAIVDAHNMFPRALDAIERVLRVHWPDEFADAPGEYFCNECQRAQLNGEWPCATVQAIEGAINHE